MNFNLYQLYQEITSSNIANEFIQNPKIFSKITYDKIISEINSIVNDINFSNFDDNHLPLEDVIKLSQRLSLPLKYFFDDYYKYIFLNCSSQLRNWRNKNKINIKKAAGILAVSPTDLSKWENKKSYPTRKQYIKIRLCLRTRLII